MPELRESQKQQRRRPRGPQQLRAATSSSAGDGTWKRFGKSSNPLDETVREQALKSVQNLFYSSPIAHRMIEQIADFIVGEHGFSLTSEDDVAAGVLEEFWSSPLNRIPQQLYDIVQEYFVYGEAAFLVNVHNDGFVAVTYIPSPAIDDVNRDQEEVMEPGELIIGKESYDIIRWNQVQQRLEGDAFFFRTRHLGSNMRGIPRLLPMVDFLRAWDAFIYNYLKRRAMYDAVWWEVELEGYTQPQIDEWLSKPSSSPPQAGSVFAHNEKVEWNLKQADFNATALKSDGGFLLNYLEGSSGLSDFTQTDQRRRRERGEMLDPVARGLAARQYEVRSIFRYMGKFVLQEARRAGAVPIDNEGKAICRAPRLGVRDIQRSSGALAKYVDALDQAQNRDWIDSQEAERLFRAIISRLDLGGKAS